jgi:hypothetical protein
MVQKPVEDRPDRRSILKQLSPLLQRTAAGHDDGAVFIPSHHHMKQVFPRLLGQRLQSHAVDHNDVRLEIVGKVWSYCLKVKSLRKLRTRSKIDSTERLF